MPLSAQQKAIFARLNEADRGPAGRQKKIRKSERKGFRGKSRKQRSTINQDIRSEDSRRSKSFKRTGLLTLGTGITAALGGAVGGGRGALAGLALGGAAAVTSGLVARSRKKKFRKKMSNRGFGGFDPVSGRREDRMISHQRGQIATLKKQTRSGQIFKGQNPFDRVEALEENIAFGLDRPIDKGPRQKRKTRAARRKKFEKRFKQGGIDSRAQNGRLSAESRRRNRGL